MEDCKALQERLQEVGRMLRTKCPAFELVEPEKGKAPVGSKLQIEPIPFTPEFKSPNPPSAPAKKPQNVPNPPSAPAKKPQNVPNPPSAPAKKPQNAPKPPNAPAKPAEEPKKPQNAPKKPQNAPKQNNKKPQNASKKPQNNKKPQNAPKKPQNTSKQNNNTSPNAPKKPSISPSTKFSNAPKTFQTNHHVSIPPRGGTSLSNRWITDYQSRLKNRLAAAIRKNKDSQLYRRNYNVLEKVEIFA